MNTLQPLDLMLIVIGIALMLRAVLVTSRMRRVAPGPAYNTRRMMWLARGFRWFVVALGFIGSGFGLALDASWLMWLSIVFGIEELYEGTLILASLKRVARVELRA
jgi:hypothetical protein